MIEDNHIYKSHNKSLLLYHLVFVIKYRKKIITNDVEEYIKEICKNIENGYEIKFIEIGFDQDHIHFLLQSVPNLSITKIVTTIKSIIARELFKYKKEIKKILYNGNFWTSGYYVILNHPSTFTYLILNTSFKFLKKSEQYNANFFNLFFKKDQYFSIGLKSGE